MGPLCHFRSQGVYVMVLAAIDPLVFDEVQLLADCFGPLFVTEIPIVAEALILRVCCRHFLRCTQPARVFFWRSRRRVDRMLKHGLDSTGSISTGRLSTG